MAARAENPGMWIRTTPIPHGGGHYEGYGEAQSTRNSRYLELADVILSNDVPLKGKASAVAVGSENRIHRHGKH